jgi:hypothetical protein
MADNKEELLNIILYIKQKIGDMSQMERKDILQMIMNSGIDDSKIHSKGSGTQIKFKDIPKESLCTIYNYMQNKIKEKIEKLNNFTEENEEI